MKSIRSKLLVMLLTSLVILVGGAAGYTVILTRKALTEATGSFAIKTALENAANIEKVFGAAFETAITGAALLETMKNQNFLNKDFFNAYLFSLLEKHEDILMVWASFEPDGWIGLQENGYYAPYFWREGEEASGQYWWEREAYLEDLGQDYHILPKKSGVPTIIEPYVDETEDGVFVLLTSVTVPLYAGDGRFFGVFGLDISLDTLGEAVNGISFLESGYAALISSSGIFVAHPRKELVGTAIADVESPEGIKAFSSVTADGVTRKFTVYSQVAKKNVVRILVPVEIGNTGERWAFVLMVPENELMATSNRIIVIVSAMGGALLAVIIVILLLTTRKITRPLKDFGAVFAGLADGDFTLNINIRSGDELQTLGDQFNGLTGRLRDAMASVFETTGELQDQGDNLAEQIETASDSVRRIKDNAKDLEELIRDQTGIISVTALAVSNINGGIQGLDQNIHNQSAAVTESSASIEEMVSNIKSVNAGMEKLKSHFEILLFASEKGKEKIANVKTQVNEVVARSAGLMETNKLIAAIAAQTNLLSMNAAIEAAHAGEAGKGFSVVAGEVRNLAATAAERAKQIAAELKSLKSIIADVMNATTEAEDSFASIKEDVGDVNSLVMEIKNALSEQDAGSHQILDALAEINDITANVRSASESLSGDNKTILAAVENLKSISEKVSEGIRIITSGAGDIGFAMAKVGEMGKLNQEKIDAVEKGLSKFKIS